MTRARMKKLKASNGNENNGMVAYMEEALITSLKSLKAKKGTLSVINYHAHKDSILALSKKGRLEMWNISDFVCEEIEEMKVPFPRDMMMLKENSINFTDDFSEKAFGEYEDLLCSGINQDSEIFNLEDGSIEEISRYASHWVLPSSFLLPNV
ncbi:hypothetical protein M9H77_26832 [Catharanthus roseus]|uniref:Uncharacterized protein n=1 Tax=Catharanthus roseus TaxID=4058 RepID=A0ACC0ABN2_CATRO|nr:hypothetical protein M9H77_26832 [Catharanthus roseus]